MPREELVTFVHQNIGWVYSRDATGASRAGMRLAAHPLPHVLLHRGSIARSEADEHVERTACMLHRSPRYHKVLLRRANARDHHYVYTRSSDAKRGAATKRETCTLAGARVHANPFGAALSNSARGRTPTNVRTPFVRAVLISLPRRSRARRGIARAVRRSTVR